MPICNYKLQKFEIIYIGQNTYFTPSSLKRSLWVPVDVRVLCPYLVIFVRNKSGSNDLQQLFWVYADTLLQKNAVYSNGKIDLSLHNGATLKRKAHAIGAVVASYMQFSRSKSTQRCAACRAVVFLLRHCAGVKQLIRVRIAVTKQRKGLYWCNVLCRHMLCAGI